jgi:hypothetical protein
MIPSPPLVGGDGNRGNGKVQAEPIKPNDLVLFESKTEILAKHRDALRSVFPKQKTPQI